MNQDMYGSSASQPQKPRNNTLIIVVVVALVLCCLCAIAAGVAWQYGDSILQALGVSY